ncbi:hypothetical protein C8R44DRAFT_365384 [Mycena epipterygia]|nr:hypothetical protein C8R44DRAFT_365384 [Mycena epipterygia]
MRGGGACGGRCSVCWRRRCREFGIPPSDPSIAPFPPWTPAAAVVVQQPNNICSQMTARTRYTTTPTDWVPDRQHQQRQRQLLRLSPAAGMCTRLSALYVRLIRLHPRVRRPHDRPSSRLGWAAAADAVGGPARTRAEAPPAASGRRAQRGGDEARPPDFYASCPFASPSPCSVPDILCSCALRTIAVYLLCAASALCAPPLLSAPPPLAMLRLHTPAPAPRAPLEPPSFFLGAPRCGDVTRTARDCVQTPPCLSSTSPCSWLRLHARVHSRAPTGVPRRTPETRCCP